ncbi:hypothetical protein VNO77_02148 [Canavalia gladiata]|uniref:Uncharacterized protein n=1 Tax=Canavalia gladiata TaxID=3824 RepID=A0AAN9R5N0_CANGL
MTQFEVGPTDPLRGVAGWQAECITLFKRKCHAKGSNVGPGDCIGQMGKKSINSMKNFQIKSSGRLHIRDFLHYTELQCLSNSGSTVGTSTILHGFGMGILLGFSSTATSGSTPSIWRLLTHLICSQIRGTRKQLQRRRLQLSHFSCSIATSQALHVDQYDAHNMVRTNISQRNISIVSTDDLKGECSLIHHDDISYDPIPWRTATFTRT